MNGAKAGSWLLLERQGALYATPDAFDEWRLTRDPSARGVEFRGRVFHVHNEVALPGQGGADITPGERRARF